MTDLFAPQPAWVWVLRGFIIVIGLVGFALYRWTLSCEAEMRAIEQRLNGSLVPHEPDTSSSGDGR